MKLQLNESGLRNIRELSKNYQEAWIYGHIDLDGITSSLVMKYYLAQYGIKTTNWIPIQYGAQEYSVPKVPEHILGVLVDFSHGKIQFKIHTDHHASQIAYPNQSKQFAHSKSNADTISSVISPSIIMSPEDMRVVNMVDSAGYADEGITVKDIRNYVYNFKKDSSNKENQLKFGMVVNKLLLAYKNKPNYLKTIVLESKPSLLSMYNTMISTINEHINAGDKGWNPPSVLQGNSEWYRARQKENIVKNGSVASIDELNRGKNAVIGNCVVQVGGGQMNKVGSYDRYTAFDLHPDCQYFVMIWDTIGMMQVCTNNWNPEVRGKDIDLGEIVLKKIFEGKYKPLLDKPKYAISLLAIKKSYEENITSENELEAMGFDMNEFKALMSTDFDVTEKQKKWLDTVMSYKPSQLIPNETDTDKQREYKFKCTKFLNSFKIPLSEIILKTSGGHKTITNLNGFGFLNEQQRINKALRDNRNPYEKNTKDTSSKKDTKDESKYESTSLKILKSIAKDVVNKLNGEKINETVNDNFGMLYDDATEEFNVGDQFIFLKTNYTITGKTLKIVQKRKITGSPEVYVLRTLDGSKDITITKKRLIQYIIDGDIERVFDDEPDEDGSLMLDSIQYISENYHRDEIPETPPDWGYDAVITYQGYDFAIEAIVERDDRYYHVSVYKSNIENDDEAELTEITFDTWDEVREYIASYDINEDNPYKKSYYNDVNVEPESEGDELDETKASRFNKHLDDTEKSFATISAERSMPQITDRPTQRGLNHRRTKVLEKLLKAWGLKGFIKTKGGFDEKGQPRVEINGDLSEEDSFFVPNITKEQAIRLGKLFNQDSVMFKEKGSNQVKELRTNVKGGDEGIGSETGLVFIVGQGRHNIGHDKTYYSRPKGSMIKFAFNPDDESN